MTIKTCKTFATEAEARAFMLGFHLTHEGILCSIDPEEPQAILIDFEDTEADTAFEAEAHYLEVVAGQQEETEVSDGLDAAVRAVIEPALITAIDREIKCGSCTLTALLNDGSTRKLFSFYIDELTFSDSELIGKTEAEAHQLSHEKSVSYLRS